MTGRKAASAIVLLFAVMISLAFYFAETERPASPGPMNRTAPPQALDPVSAPESVESASAEPPPAEAKLPLIEASTPAPIRTSSPSERRKVITEFLRLFRPEGDGRNLQFGDIMNELRELKERHPGLDADLISMLDDPLEQNTRWDVQKAMSMIATQATLAALVRNAKDFRIPEGERAGIVHILRTHWNGWCSGPLDPARALFMMEMTTDPSVEVRTRLAVVMPYGQEPEAREVLHRLTLDPEEAVVRYTVSSLGQMGTRESYPFLQAAASRFPGLASLINQAADEIAQRESLESPKLPGNRFP